MVNKTVEHISLSQLNTLIGEAIALHLDKSYWIVAEIVELRENYSGHCYLSLAEKQDDKVLAQSRASIWQQTYRMIKPYFESATGQAFSSGIKVRIKVAASFHNVYGLNLTVQDIDPAYTVGELSLRRQQILKLLLEDGVADMNKELDMPIAPQRIAVISSPTAAGYEDFLKQLGHNPYGFSFKTTLFPATMQGDGAEASIIKAMDAVYERIDQFDVLVLIRGGGAAIDLSCFDNYNIAFHLTQFPLPVLVGIGHERDETVLDLVAHTSFKTPTAVAAYLIECLLQVDAQINEVVDRLQTTIHQISTREKQRLYSIAAGLPAIASRLFTQKKVQLHQKVFALRQLNEHYFADKKSLLDEKVRRLQLTFQELWTKEEAFLEKAKVVAELSDPRHLLQKGYSITLKDGRALRSSEELQTGDQLTTLLHKGQVKSVVD